MTVTDTKPGKVCKGTIGTGLSSLEDADLHSMMSMVKRERISWETKVTMTVGMLESMIWELKK